MQYRNAVERLMPYRTRNACIRMRFDEALPLFPDETFDFIYVDGYAHTGEDDGRTFADWWPKLKRGGVFAGDDYHPDFPGVVKHVDAFVARHGLRFHLLDCEPLDDWASQYPTWVVFKS